MGRRQSKHTLVCLELKPRPWNCYPGGVYGIISLKLSLKPYWRRDARCMSDKKLLGGGGEKKERKRKDKGKKMRKHSRKMRKRAYNCTCLYIYIYIYLAFFLSKKKKKKQKKKKKEGKKDPEQISAQSSSRSVNNVYT